LDATIAGRREAENDMRRLTLSLRVLFCVSAMLAVGCAPVIASATLVDRGRADVVAAMADYRHKRMVVTGKIKRKEMVARYDNSSTAVQILPGVAHVDHSTEKEQLPVLYLEPDGLVACMFEERDLSSVAKLQPGQEVSLLCWFSEYQKAEGHQLAVLTNCSIK
jgi:hypothetical protein